MPVDRRAEARAVSDGEVRVIDLTQTLSQEFPTIVLPPELGQCARFRIEEVSRYDERGPAWYWNNISLGEHTGTHFDAPIHWISGKDLPNNAVDTIDVAKFIAPAVVIDCSKECAANPDFALTIPFVEQWEARYGKIEPGHWALLRTDWSKRNYPDYAGLRDDGAHTPGPEPAVVKWFVEQRDVRSRERYASRAENQRGRGVRGGGFRRGRRFAVSPRCRLVPTPGGLPAGPRPSANGMRPGSAAGALRRASDGGHRNAPSRSVERCRARSRPRRSTGLGQSARRPGAVDR